MKGDIVKLKHIITRDKMMDLTKLPDIISAEVSRSLSHFFDTKSCVTRVKVDGSGGFQVSILINAERLKPFI